MIVPKEIERCRAVAARFSMITFFFSRGNDKSDALIFKKIIRILVEPADRKVCKLKPSLFSYAHAHVHGKHKCTKL